MKTRDEFIVALQGNLIGDIDAMHHGIDALTVHLRKTQSAGFQEKMACVLHIVEVVGIVHDSLDIALIVAHLHTGFKNLTHIMDVVYRLERKTTKKLWNGEVFCPFFFTLLLFL